MPWVKTILVNKHDLTEQWAFDDALTRKISDLGWHFIMTSAKTGEGVEEAFNELTLSMIS